VAVGANGSFTNDLQTSGTAIGDGGYDGNNNTIATITGVTPLASGQIQLTVSALTGGFGYINAMEIIETPTPPSVTLGIQPSGGSLILNWPNGTLLEATNVVGPWITNGASSPYTITPTAPQKFYRVQVQ